MCQNNIAHNITQPQPTPRHFILLIPLQQDVDIINGEGVDEEEPPTKWQKQVINKAAAPFDSSEDEVARKWYLDNNQDESSFGPAATPKSKDTEPYVTGLLGKVRVVKFRRNSRPQLVQNDHI